MSMSRLRKLRTSPRVADNDSIVGGGGNDIIYQERGGDDWKTNVERIAHGGEERDRATPGDILLSAHSFALMKNGQKGRDQWVR